MVGVMDNGKFGTSKDHDVIVKLQKDCLNDLHVGYNRMKLMSHKPGEGFGESSQQVELSKGDTYQIKNYMWSGRNLVFLFTDVS
jgi:hypothetical protein